MHEKNSNQIRLNAQKKKIKEINSVGMKLVLFNKEEEFSRLTF